MKTVQKIIGIHGGFEALKEKYIRIENPPYMRLAVEHIGTGPRGFYHVSVAHYYQQNGDPMRDPEMTFEIITADKWLPVSFQHDSPPIYQEAVYTNSDGEIFVNPILVKKLNSFALLWDKNLNVQEFVRAYKDANKI